MASIASVPVNASTVEVRIKPRHHALVRFSHWMNIPILLLLGLSGMSIYWASPVFNHAADATGNTDTLADIGRWVVAHVPFCHGYSNPDQWVYNHVSLGTGLLAPALRLHWLCVYLFILNGLLYVIGLALGKGYRSLLPRRTDVRDSAAMIVYYLGLLPAKVRKKSWKHPTVTTKYNSLQRGAYFAMPMAGLLAVMTGWAMHKPVQLGWLAALFGGYDWARVWHFWLTWIFAAFVIPHVILVAADGFNTFRSMITGWTIERDSHEA